MHGDSVHGSVLLIPTRTSKFRPGQFRWNWPGKCDAGPKFPTPCGNRDATLFRAVKSPHPSAV
jgi:hypothetical protein